MNDQVTAIARSQEQVLQTNKVIRNTYMLLSMTLVFSALTSGIAVLTAAPAVHWLLSLAIMIGLLFAVSKARNSVWALPLVFLFTGYMGYQLGPIISYYLTLPNGGSVVTTALGMTGLIFFALSGYALTTRKDFSFMRGFLFVGLLVLIAAMLVGIFFEISGMQLAISVMAVLLFSGFILYDTSNIIHGGETNYVMATVALYLNIYNLFIHLLHLVGAFSGDD
ncbi:Bax inhibitor-1/YccA family protein [Aestuariirhabdus litorea]|uniref:Bax inhibitor-1/YccA family protein n=1 Tax=Aestuariirhabdus litorea TaxID=2528527 RepID=A0A3P3VTI5_9GAMM|nr:Bax inhibitor-1/YccA family protein [Aestuariirhabdus litorea]RRJ84779.1 Bax inhibitor-1/YccA family protein [Aestuariirhabdus litorea]RWW98003.1 Bax inhibitor-1/YccA family protein [Endozoicomonadaceae bacterium GTF-13]